MVFRRAPPAECEARNVDYFGALAVPEERLAVGEPITAEALVETARRCRARVPYVLTVQEDDDEPVTIFLKRAKRGFKMIEVALDFGFRSGDSFWGTVGRCRATSKNVHGGGRASAPLWPATCVVLGKHPWIAPCVRLLQATASPGTYVFVEIRGDAVARLRGWEPRPEFRAETKNYGKPWDEDGVVPFLFVMSEAGVGAEDRWAWNAGLESPELRKVFEGYKPYVAFYEGPERSVDGRPVIVSADEEWYERHTDAASSDSPLPSSEEDPQK